MKKRIEIKAGYDKRKEGYGVHGCELYFILKGEKGAIIFSISTNWMTPEVQKETDERIPTQPFPYLFHKPMPSDFGFHALEPIEDYLKDNKIDNCCWLDNRPCYCDDSGLYADTVFNILTTQGSDGVWKHMEEYYKDKFKSEI